MENQTVPTKPIMLRYGIILGFLTVLASVLSYVIEGTEQIERPFWEKALGYIIIIAIIIMAIKKFKELNNGNLTIGEAIKTGVGVALIGGLIVSVYIFIFFSYIEPDFINRIMEMTQEKMIEQNPDMPEEQMEMALSMTSKFMSPIAMMLFSIIGNLIMGLIISLIAGLIMKHKEEYI